MLIISNSILLFFILFYFFLLSGCWSKRRKTIGEFDRFIKKEMKEEKRFTVEILTNFARNAMHLHETNVNVITN